MESGARTPLIGKLNAYKNQNTSSFFNNATDTQIDYTWDQDLGTKDTFSQRDEAILIHLIEYILGWEDEWNDGELAKYLKIDKVLEDLQCALLNTKL